MAAGGKRVAKGAAGASPGRAQGAAGKARPAGPPPAPLAEASLEPRRLPTQARARQTVERVLAAAGAQIDRDGLDRLTTKRIAERAGLSVGALYEYFPNKESIVSALAEEWMQRVYEAVDSVHPRHGGGRDLLSYLNEQMERVSRLYEDQPGLGALVGVLGAVPALRALAQRHDELVAESVSSALLFYAPRQSREGAEAAARFISVSCHAVLSAALIDRIAPAPLLLAHLRGALVAIAGRVLLGD